MLTDQNSSKTLENFTHFDTLNNTLPQTLLQKARKFIYRRIFKQ